MGLTVPVLPVKWGPRAILKLREVNRSDFEKFEVKLLILRADVDTDWDDLDKSIWVKFEKFREMAILIRKEIQNLLDF